MPVAGQGRDVDHLCPQPDRPRNAVRPGLQAPGRWAGHRRRSRLCGYRRPDVHRRNPRTGADERGAARGPPPFATRTGAIGAAGLTEDGPARAEAGDRGGRTAAWGEGDCQGDRIGPGTGEVPAASRRAARAGGARRRASADDVDREGEAPGPAGRPRPPVSQANVREKRDDGGRAAKADQPRARPHGVLLGASQNWYSGRRVTWKPGPPVSIGLAPSRGTRIVLRHRPRPWRRAAKLACPLNGAGGRNVAVPAAWSKSKAEAGPRTTVVRQIYMPSRISILPPRKMLFPPLWRWATPATK